LSREDAVDISRKGVVNPVSFRRLETAAMEGAKSAFADCLLSGRSLDRGPDADLVGLDGAEGGHGTEKIKKGGGAGGADGIGNRKNYVITGPWRNVSPRASYNWLLSF